MLLLSERQVQMPIFHCLPFWGYRLSCRIGMGLQHTLAQWQEITSENRNYEYCADRPQCFHVLEYGHPWIPLQKRRSVILCIFSNASSRSKVFFFIYATVFRLSPSDSVTIDTSFFLLLDFIIHQQRRNFWCTHREKQIHGAFNSSFFPFPRGVVLRQELCSTLSVFRQHS